MPKAKSFCFVSYSRGLARMMVFRHNHEIENGRTSSIAQHIMGFRESGEIMNYGSGASPPR
jgi:GTPase